MTDGLDAARALLPGVVLEPDEPLGGNDRTTVDRIVATYPNGAEARLVVKQYHHGEGWARESAALCTLPRGLRTPRVVAAGHEPPVIVLEDLGPGPSVADALVGDDPIAADAAVIEWATVIAELHAASRGLRGAFRTALSERQRHGIGESHVGVDVDDAVRILDAECGALGTAVPAGALDEMRGLVKRLGGSGLAALTPADACPDNNVRTGDGLVLVDFEGAQWRHIAWDVAYLRVPWPTCWCSWRIPDSTSDRAVEAYVHAARTQIPEVDDPAFARDVDAAVMGWALMTTAWFIRNAVGDDPPLNPDRPTPTRRAMIQHRLDLAARMTELPAVAELAGNLTAVLRRRWGEVPLAMAPAFRGGQ